MSENKVEFLKESVIKEYTSRKSFLNEERVYKKLEGSGLAPKLLYSWDGRIEHEYVAGEPLSDLILANIGRLPALASYFEAFFKWYEAYKEKTNLVLGSPDFSKFIMKDSGSLVCFDYENCKPGFIEDDLAILAVRLIHFNSSYSEAGIESAKLFLCIAASYFRISAEQLETSLRREMESCCFANNIPFDSDEYEYIVTYMTSAGIILHEGLHNLDNYGKLIAYMPQRMIYSRIIDPGITGFEFLLSSGKPATADNIAKLLGMTNQTWLLLLDTNIPADGPETIKKLLSAPKTTSDVLLMKKDDQNSFFPMLLRAKTCFDVFSRAAANPGASLHSVLVDLKIRVIEQ